MPVDDAASDGHSRVKSADRAITIVEHLAVSTSPQSLNDLCSALEIPKISLHGLLRTLQARLWVEVTADGSRYGLGPRALAVGAGRLAADDVVERAQSVLDALASQTEESVHLGRLEGRHIVYVAKRESIHPLRLVSAVGVRLPAHATALGKALLALRSDDELRALLPSELEALTPRTVTSVDALLQGLAEIRRSGYAVEQGEAMLGVTCLAVAVRTPHPARHALSCSIPDSRVGNDTHRQVVDSLIRARDELERLGSGPGTAEGP